MKDGKLLYLPNKGTELIRTISEAQKSRQLLTIERKETGDDEFDVYVLSRSADLLLGAFINDFNFDGYFIIKTDGITMAKPFSRLYTLICNEETDPRKIAAPDIDLTSWMSALSFAAFKTNIISVEGYHYGEEYRLYGLVSELKESSFMFSSFDLNGEWDADYELSFDEITSIFFYSRYERRWQKYLSEHRIYGAVSDSDCDYYTHLLKLFNTIDNEQMNYNWLISDCECLSGDINVRETFSSKSFVSGSELTDLIRTDDFQWIWGVLSGFKKDIPQEEILAYPTPLSERTGHCGSYPSISHPLAEIEITAFDSSMMYFYTRDRILFERFVKGYPKCRIMDQPIFDA